MKEIEGRISQDEFDRLMIMSKSPDKENVILVREIINNLDFDVNLIYIICLVRIVYQGSYNKLANSILKENFLKVKLLTAFIIYQNKEELIKDFEDFKLFSKEDILFFRSNLIEKNFIRKNLYNNILNEKRRI